MLVLCSLLTTSNLIRSSIFSLLRRLQESENRLFVNYFYTDIHFRSPTIFSLDHPFFSILWNFIYMSTNVCIGSICISFATVLYFMYIWTSVWKTLIIIIITGMDNLFVQPASRTLIACPGRTDGLCPSQVERNNDVPLFAVDARNTWRHCYIINANITSFRHLRSRNR